ncbi:hypothetical protein WJX72_010908 [[Myrmecia] bisecta]|uniref:Uncharacterized protein n=1 Tax=[Myrmecia] bisecta TaxID=41462 RepID=A0AAW1QGL2_9CHLO
MGKGGVGVRVVTPPNAQDAAQPEDTSSPSGQEAELPLPYAVSTSGRKEPLPGVQSIFLTGTTIEIIGLQALAGDGRGMLYVPKEKLLKDVQFRGAISDFHPIRDKIQGADCDPVLIKSNPEDLYGDGNNFEIACSRAAADTWEFIEAETVRRQQAAQLAAASPKAAAKAVPKVHRDWLPRPWTSMGSEIEVDEASVRPGRQPIVMTAHRRRKDFHRAFTLTDKDASELWNSSQMECRPFKDPKFDLNRMEQDAAVQAVAELQSRATQATGRRPLPGSSQSVPIDMAEEERTRILHSAQMAGFLGRVQNITESALQQNEVTNIFEDDFAALAEDDGLSGNRKENVISEYQSFTDLLYSKNKVVSAIQWLPHRKGVVAVACTEPLSFSERMEVGGSPAACAILIWNFKDPIHPEYVLEAPVEVFAFQCNPLQPDIVTAGAYNGQVLMWDTSAEEERLAHAKSAPKEEGGEGGEGSVPVVKHTHLSLVDASHHAAVTDLHWLPGITISRDGKAIKVLEDKAKECNFFATTAADGKVLFWDMRVGHNRRKVKKEREDDEVEWKPTYVVTLLSAEGGDLAACKCSFSLKDALKSQFFVGSFDGELVYSDYLKPEAEGGEQGDQSSVVAAHSGAVVMLARSPFFDDILLSVGDWTFGIWKETAHSCPLFLSPFAAAMYTAGCWSPTRPGVVFVGRADGVLEVWDLLDRSHEASMTAAPTSTAITSLAFSPAGAPATAGTRAVQQLLAIGDSLGVLHIMDLPRNLRRRVPNEIKTVSNFLKRELARLDYVAACQPTRARVLKEIQETQKAAEAEKAEDKAEEGVLPGPLPTGEEFDEASEAAYKKMEHDFKVQLGLIKENIPPS